MDSAVKPYVDAPICCRHPSAVISGMVKKRQLATTSPGDKPRRNAKVLERTEAMVATREGVAANVKWLLINSSARGSVPRMHDETGLGINTIKRVLAAANGTTIDTLSVIADAYGVPVASLFQGLTDKDQHMVKMFARMKGDIERLEAKAAKS